MRIAVYAPVLAGVQISAFDRFLVRTLAFNFHAHKEISFIILSHVDGTHIGLNNVEQFDIREQPQGSIAKRIWWDIVVPGALKKIKADLFISVGDRCSSTTSIPQSLVIDQAQKLNRRSLFKAGSVLVAADSFKKLIAEKYRLDKEKIWVVQLFADPEYKPVAEIQKEKIKERYSNGREFFLSHSANDKEVFIELLKAFSLFKKRQESSLKLLVIGNPDAEVEKSLTNYKYREDVTLVYPGEKNIISAITASAYAVLLTNGPIDLWEGFEAMQAGSPVITIKNSDLHGITGDAVLAAENNSTKSIGEKMMQIYIDEKLRTSLVEKGRSAVRPFSLEKTSGQVWQAFMKALN
jgi:glycosyltransferase involved in cell wall biosynthesis